MKFLGIVLAFAMCPLALAAPPPAPHVSVAATDIRQLEFSYTPVPGVARYELWFRSAPGAQWVKYHERAAQRGPLFRIAVSVHLLDWRQARYYVKACNPSGCTASNEVGVDGEQLVAMGYIKPREATGHTYFGSNVAASADGKTIAVLAGEDIGTTHVSATVHVYRKTTSTSGWRREARLVPSTVQSATTAAFLGDPIALSGDGNLLLLGTAAEDTTGANPREDAGAVYLFRRTGTTWRLAQKLTGENYAGDSFGWVVKVDDAGRTLAISHGNQQPGTVEIYRDPDDASDQFVHSQRIPVELQGSVNGWCGAIALSGDGQTLLRSCYYFHTGFYFTQILNGPGFGETRRITGGSGDGLDVSYDGTKMIVQNNEYADAYRRTPDGWISDGYLEAIDGAGAGGRRHIAISRDGKIAVNGNAAEFTVGLGPVYPPYQANEDDHAGSGGVIVHHFKQNRWMVRRLVKPGSAYQGWAGNSVALGDNGRLLVVGAPMDASAATGIDGDREDESVPWRGGVWVY